LILNDLGDSNLFVEGIFLLLSFFFFARSLLRIQNGVLHFLFG
jgi:hypothetical protein